MAVWAADSPMAAQSINCSSAEQGRARQHEGGDVRLVAGEAEHQVGRRVFGAGEAFGQRAPHQGRGVVEQGEKEPFRLVALVAGARRPWR